MKESVRKILLVSLISLTTIGVAYSAFLTYQVSLEDKILNENLFNIEFHYTENGSESVKVLNELEIDSGLDLLNLYDYEKTFLGWSFVKNSTAKLMTKSTTVKTLIDNSPTFTNNTILLYDVWDSKIPSNQVLFSISDMTETGFTYLLKTDVSSTFSLFNIKFKYPGTVVNITIDGKNYGINDIIDINAYGGRKIPVTVSR